MHPNSNGVIACHLACGCAGTTFQTDHTSAFMIWLVVLTCFSGCFSHLEKYEFVNGKDDIPYMKWKIIHSMFETTSQRCMIIARIGQIGHQNAQIVGPQTRFIFGSPKGEDPGYLNPLRKPSICPPSWMASCHWSISCREDNEYKEMSWHVQGKVLLHIAVPRLGRKEIVPETPVFNRNTNRKKCPANIPCNKHNEP